VRYHSMYSFKYSERPNTLASKRMPEDVPEEEKTRRIVALQSLQKQVQGELFAAAVGRSFDVLVDARSRRREWELSGRTSGNTVVNFSGDPEWIGRTLPVRVTAANPNSLKGEAVTFESVSSGA
jgi:tRNA-2-methylthio-N6-dimethylallyladenosine synthase